MSDRFEHNYLESLRPGKIFQDDECEEWIFCGWLQNTVGRFPFFTKVCKNDRVVSGGAGWGVPFTYHAANTTSLLKKFPGLRDYIHNPGRWA